MDLALVIPCFNEAARLPRFLPGLAEALADLAVVIQVVDDGSAEENARNIYALVETWRAKYPGRIAPLLRLPVNQGKGAAIRAGWREHPEARLLGFVDADGSIPPNETRRLVEIALADPGQAHFGSRVKMLGYEVSRTVGRHLAGRVFATITSSRLQVPVYDSQCGLKIVPAAFFHRAKDHFAEDRFAFDPELLVALLELGYRIREVPVDWADVAGSKVHLLRDSFRMYQSLGRISRRRGEWTALGRRRPAASLSSP